MWWEGTERSQALDAPSHGVNLGKDLTSLLPEPRTVPDTQEMLKKRLPNGNDKRC